MRPLESSALAGLAGILGLGGGQGGGPTDFDDVVLQQMLDVTTHIRRRRSNSSTTGMFITAVANTHAAGETVNSFLPVYDVAAGTAGPWPKPIPETHDVWLLAIRARVTTQVAAVFTGARAIVNFPSSGGFNPALTPTAGGGAAVTGGLGLEVGVFSAELAVGGTYSLVQPTTMPALVQLPFRIPRGSQLLWQTTTVGAGAPVYRIEFLLGVFPAGFGQDVIGAV